MKKILVAVASAALAVTGMAAPAHATGTTYPGLTGGTNGNATIGSTLTSVPGSYTNGFSVVVSGIMFCTAAENIAQGTGLGTLINFNQASPRCDWVNTDSLGSRTQATWTVGNFYDGYTSTLRTNITGWYLRFAEIVSDGSNFATYYSSPLQIAAAAQTVTYDANTGTGSITASVANGARNVSDGSGLSRSGFTFAGWNTAANGTGTAVAAGASYTPSGNVTLYAQWNRVPTPAAPVFTSPIAVAPTGGILNLTGSNLANVTSVTVGNTAATVSSSASGQVTVKLPDLAPGKYDITIKNADGGIRFIDGLVVPDPNAKVAPKPTNTYVAGTAIKVAGGTVSAKQSTALTEFVAQYKTAKQATVFIRTSKAGLPAAKKAAAAMIATVVKTLKNVKTGIVVDSTSETTTALDLVVTD